MGVTRRPGGEAADSSAVRPAGRADATSIFDGRTIPAGMKGTVLEARSDGSCLAEFAFAPQTADSDGDFVHGILTREQYDIIETCPSRPWRSP